MIKNKAHLNSAASGAFVRNKVLALLISTTAVLEPSYLEAQTTPGPQPSICSRSCWSARSGSCTTTMTLNRAIIHHTAGGEYNTTGLESSKSYVRGIQNMDMDVDGWCDIGYHFMVDKFGNIFECRKNSISGYPRGAHDSVNSSSFGFTFMGYFHSPNNNAPTSAMMNKMYDLIAWKMPSGWSPYGSGTYDGATVGKIDGHRKVRSTACPGDLIHPSYITENYSGGPMRNGVAARRGGGGGSGRLDVFCRGSNNGLYQMWSGNGGTTWGNWVALGGTLASDPSAVSWGPNVIHVFVRGTTGALVYKSWNGSSWADWISLGGSFVGGPDAASWGSGRLDVFVRSTTNTLHHNSWNGSAWYGWQDHGMPPGGMASDPAAVSNNSNRIHVFCRGTDNAVWYTYWSGTAWAGWESIGGNIVGSPDAATSGPGKLEVVGRAPDGTTWIKSWNGSAWSGWSSLGGTITGDPSAVSPSTGQVEVYGRGGNGSLWRKALVNGVWEPWDDLGGEILGGPDAASWTGN